MFFTCTAASHENCSHGALSPASDTAFPQAGSGHGAAGAGKPASAARKTGIASARGRQLHIDVHCHSQNNDVAAMAAPLKPFEREPSIVYANALTREVNQKQMRDRAAKLTDIETRLHDMDRMGIDVQVVSPSPSQYYYYADADFGRQLSRATNDRIAQIVAGNPDRFAGMCTVPLQDPGMAARELERCVRKLGMRGVEICTTA